jgi:hypothetical protein
MEVVQHGDLKPTRMSLMRSLTLKERCPQARPILAGFIAPSLTLTSPGNLTAQAKRRSRVQYGAALPLLLVVGSFYKQMRFHFIWISAQQIGTTLPLNPHSE